jgi:hypothetical protein
VTAIFFKHFCLVNRMSPTKPRTRNTIVLRHPVLLKSKILQFFGSCSEITKSIIFLDFYISICKIIIITIIIINIFSQGCRLLKTLSTKLIKNGQKTSFVFFFNNFSSVRAGASKLHRKFFLSNYQNLCTTGWWM